MKKIIFILLTVFAISSCNKDILELTPLDRISESSVWNDELLIEAYVNARYTSFNHLYTYHCLSSSACDEIHSTQNANGVWTMQRGEVTSDNITSLPTEFNYWSKAYSSIRDINIFFQKIDDAPIKDETLKARLKGEMKFIRAFHYANLIWRYGGVPIITDVFELGGDFSTISQASYDDCVDFICDDLDEAIALLPLNQSDDNRGRASGGAAMALKSRVLLYAASPLTNINNDLSKWQKAADAAAALFDKGYQLHDDYQTLFLQDNNELIFARYFTQASVNDINLQYGRNGDNGWSNVCPAQNIVNDYEMTNGELPYIEVGGALTVNPASGHDPQNPFINRDPRFYASILYDGSVWMGRETESYFGGLDSPQSPMVPWGSSLTAIFMKKFVPENIPPVGNSTWPTNPAVWFRYGEILLNYAEAKFELGDEATARQYINMVRSRNSVQMPPVTATGNVLRERIRHERRIELAFEGHRFFDVRRWKIAMQTENKNILGIRIIKNGDGSKTYEFKQVLTRLFEEKHYWLPIPRTEIDKSLGALTQTSGY